VGVGIRSLSLGGSAKPRASAARTSSTRSESRLLGPDVKLVWSLVPRVLCLSRLLSQLRGSPRAPRPAGAGEEPFHAAAASCRPHGVQCPLGRLVSQCRGTSSSAGCCRSAELRAWPGASRNGCGFILWKPF